MPTIKIAGYRCVKCGHEWISRKKEKPICCAKCKSAYWDRRKKRASRL